jgi:hypothetical protein
MAPHPAAPVAAVVRQVVAGLADAANSYFLNAIYYEFEGQKRFTADIYLQADDVRRPVATDDALEVDVHLHPRSGEWHPIRIPYAVIWRIQQSRSGGMQFTGADPELFVDNQVLSQLVPLWRKEVGTPQPDPST